MHTKNILAIFALASSIIAAPLASPQESGLSSAFDYRNAGGDSTSIEHGNYLKGVYNGNVELPNDQDGNVFAKDNAVDHEDNDVSGNENTIGRGDAGLNVSGKVRKEGDTTTSTQLSPTRTESAYINGVWVTIKDAIASSLPSGHSSNGNYANSVPTNGNDNVIGNNNGNDNVIGNNNQIFSNIGGINVDPIINLPRL
ncbi:hypothetical protein EYC80_004223 [Monilinia laxa]|uniref:Uncharacterized protein n=1 Tax=Monilinia laxa TaxID=61186 RepID=A0A5N6KMH0_MONLA|nr:hypothetical protein EYC80_004223 [Monilinia laxa]